MNRLRKQRSVREDAPYDVATVGAGGMRTVEGDGPYEKIFDAANYYNFYPPVSREGGEGSCELKTLADCIWGAYNGFI